jgi:hypothetical protein
MPAHLYTSFRFIRLTFPHSCPPPLSGKRGISQLSIELACSECDAHIATNRTKIIGGIRLVRS